VQGSLQFLSVYFEHPLYYSNWNYQKYSVVSLLLDVLNIYKQKSQNSSVTANTNGVKLEKKNTITNGNNGKQVKEARMTPPPVNIKDIKSTEVLSMDVIPKKTYLTS
jgi:hypothetical protein